MTNLERLQERVEDLQAEISRTPINADALQEASKHASDAWVRLHSQAVFGDLRKTDTTVYATALNEATALINLGKAKHPRALVGG